MVKKSVSYNTDIDAKNKCIAKLNEYLDELIKYAPGCSMYRRARSKMCKFKEYATSISPTPDFTGMLFRRDTFFGEIQFKRLLPFKSTARKYIAAALAKLKSEGITDEITLTKKVNDLMRKRRSCVNVDKMFQNLVHPKITQLIDEIYQVFNEHCNVSHADDPKLHDLLFVQYIMKTYFDHNRQYSAIYTNIKAEIQKLSTFGVFDHTYNDIFCTYEILTYSVVNELTALKASIVELYGESVLMKFESEVATISIEDRAHDPSTYRIVALIDDIDYADYDDDLDD